MPEALSYICPFCESEVRVGKPCAKCEQRAAKAKRGKKSWEQDPSSDGLDLPDEDFDYNAFVAREFGDAPHRQTGLPWYWWVFALAVLAAMICGVFLIG